MEATTLFPKLVRSWGRRLLALAPLALLSAAACGPAAVHGWGGASAANGLVYTVGASQRVMALNPSARSRGETFPSEGEWQYPSDRAAGTSFSAPVVAGDAVYVSIYQLGGGGGGFFGSTPSPGALLKLDARSGGQQWRFDIPGPGGHVIGPPTVVGSTAYLGAADDVVYALDTNTGAVRWQFKSQNKVWAGVTLDERGTAYVASLDHRIYALDAATGAEKWHFDTGGAIATAPVYKDGKLYFGSSDTYLYAIDVQARASNAAFPARGEWRFTAGSWFWATPFLSGDTVYATAVDGSVYALSAAEGSQNWKQLVGTRDAGVTATPILVNGILAVPAQDGRIYALDPATGAEKWRYTTDPQGPIFSALGTDGTLLYAYSQNQRIIAVDAASGTSRWTCRTEQQCKG